MVPYSGTTVRGGLNEFQVLQWRMEKWANLLTCLGGKLNILQLLLHLSASFFLPLLHPPRPCPVRATLLGLTLGSASQMLPWGKQKHLSPAQAWLSLSDKSWGGLCQRCPACHLSPSYTISPTQPLRIHAHTSPYLHSSAFILTVWQKQVVHSLFALWPSMLSSSVGTFMQGARRVVASSKYQRRDPCTRLFSGGGPRELGSL